MGTVAIPWVTGDAHTVLALQDIIKSWPQEPEWGGGRMGEIAWIKPCSHLVQNTPAQAIFRSRRLEENVEEPLDQHLFILSGGWAAL